MPCRRINETTPGIEILVVSRDEIFSPRESYAVPGIIESDSPDADRFVDDVNEMIEKHGLWGWCQVTVTARLGSLSGKSHLGGCSYESKEDFIKSGDYYPQMVQEAIQELQLEADETYALIHVD